MYVHGHTDGACVSQVPQTGLDEAKTRLKEPSSLCESVHPSPFWRGLGVKG